MTLCVAWRNQKDEVHFASDSRYTLATNSYADVGIKVLSLPLTILNPADGNDAGTRSAYFTSELGMCFAGSAINSLAVKDSIVEALKSLQFIPGHTDTSMAGIANFIFTAYRIISKQVCATALGENGRANILVGGMCHASGRVRVFQLSTDMQNRHSVEEVLVLPGHVFVGSGEQAARENLIDEETGDLSYLCALKGVIDDPQVPSVGGHIQYGRFNASRFVVYGIVGFDEPDAPFPRQVHYWRGALDLNSEEFLKGHGSFFPGVPYINPFTVVGGF